MPSQLISCFFHACARLFLFLCFVNAQCMESGVQLNTPQKQSLFEYWGIPVVTHLPNELKDSIASYIAPQAGWWYSERTLSHDCFVGSVCIDDQNNQVITGDENGRMRRFDLVAFKEISNPHEVSQQYFVDFAGLKPLGELNNIVVKSDTSRVVKVFDRAVKIIDVSKNAHIDAQSGYECKKVFLHPKNNQDLLILENQEMNFLRNSPQRKLLVWYSLQQKKNLDVFYTEPILMPFAGCAGDLHPSGDYFVIGEGKLMTGLTLKEGLFVEQPVQWLNAGLLSAIKFSPSGKYLASCRANGVVEINIVKDSLDGLNDHRVCALDAGVVGDIQFDRCDTHFYVALNSMIFACSVNGQKLFKCHQGGFAKQIAVHPSGNMFVKVGANVQGSAAVVWKRLERPTLDQLLMRMALKKYMYNAVLLGIDPEVNDLTKETLVDWMADRFNLQEDELKSIWDSMPGALQQSIVKAFIVRGRSAQELEKKHV